jgi:hypothetical protein
MLLVVVEDSGFMLHYPQVNITYRKEPMNPDSPTHTGTHGQHLI